MTGTRDRQACGWTYRGRERAALLGLQNCHYVGPVLLVCQVDPKLKHCLHHSHHRRHQVVADSWPVRQQLFVGVSMPVDNLHLLHECRFARLAGAE